MAAYYGVVEIGNPQIFVETFRRNVSTTFETRVGGFCLCRCGFNRQATVRSHYKKRL
ncbi:hypothetical protein H6F98_25365 [Microcoleus sp. FACHB-SPT15]|uniref:hypothetical protein n=1 Tax=Microcoleus sp. FACHB-SPT15 TaxID=2692830 RepID=UPI00177A8B28|nr:hypothetical protein [Microcoleus sp. FACHB-SPT15]MBD1808758.1 hypothetical protein [Microcoleus sp. FACHB-SPT15]